MPVDNKAVDFTLQEILDQMENTYNLLEFDSGMLKDISACKDLLKYKKYSVAVMGAFKRGKSSLINALLRSKVLPADAKPTTATINRITYGRTEKVTISYKDGGAEDIPMNGLEEYVTKLTADGKARAMSIKEAIVFTPSHICQNYVDIIDTPGLEDDEEMTKITRDMIKNVDAVIVPIAATSPFDEAEANFVCQLIESENIGHVVFVVTFIDKLDETERSYEDFIAGVQKRINTMVPAELKKRKANEQIMEKARSILDDARIFGVSSYLFLKHLLTNNRSDLERSRFEEFNDKLFKIITAKQDENTVLKSVRLIKELLGRREAENKRIMERLSSKIESLSRSKQAIGDYCGGVKKQLNGLFAKNSEQIERIVSSLYPAKNTLVTMFIKALSGIRSNTHDEIKRILDKTSVDSKTSFIKEYIKPIVTQILKLFGADAYTFTAWRQTALLAHLERLDMSFSGSTNLMNELYLCAENSLNAIGFSWVCSPLPNAADYVNCNIIESVINAADISVNESVSQINKAVAGISKTWFDRISAEASMVEKKISESFSRKYEEADRKLKAQKHNYDHFENEIPKLLDKCAGLAKDIQEA